MSPKKGQADADRKDHGNCSPVETLPVVDSVRDSDRLEWRYPVLRVDWADSRVRILGQDEGQLLILLRDSREVVRRLREVWKRNTLPRSNDDEANTVLGCAIMPGLHETEARLISCVNL